MSPHIHILPDHVANQIAAGEVVERPASVVKELIENALDAGASQVDVSLRGGGKVEIRVADDGCGMGREDALLALDRHATSKIRQAEDLARIATLGFRGEALPSIAAVSRFVLETSEEDGAGTRVTVEGGRIRSADAIARRRGTTVTVRGLFGNVPARAKFLRSAATETRAASDALVLLALCHLGVGFQLRSNDRELLSLRPGTLQERIAEIWGADEAASMLELEWEAEALRLTGVTQRPDAARTGRRRFTFANGRPFLDRGLGRLVDEAYRTTVAPGLRPDYFLFLQLPSEALDVNVHPAKTEVRFRDRGIVERGVLEGLRARLAEVSSAPPLGSPGPGGESPDQGGGAPPRQVSGGERAVSMVREGGEAGQFAFFMTGTGFDDAPESRDAAPVASRLRPELWQLHDSYILAATRRGLLIIDQHSAHERVLYEETMLRFREAGAEAQRLLFPLTLTLSPAEYSAAEELAPLLGKIGFEVEAFGERTVIVRSSPNPHENFDAEQCFREMIHELAHGSPLVDTARNQHERIAKSLACKGAIKAGQSLSQEEMADLFDRLFATELPGHDVHGRPTVVRLTLEELARRFGRT
ncbi:MAG: DNA mismatch repair endonuclease MutL [Gemmatimonadota bacterium]|nr:MAG: DNA mismatch repair endonuclease MutL [Gemmatimonadota bacterium]